MKKLTLLIALAFIIQATAFSQPRLSARAGTDGNDTVGQACLPEGITFSTQAEIDSFQINYPNCTEIEGSVHIVVSDISNLNGLNVLTAIHGSLVVSQNYYLTDMSGLNQLTEIGENLSITFSDNISSFNGLNNLQTIGGRLNLFNNNNLNSFYGLENLKSIGSNMSVGSCFSLENFLGLENLTSIGDTLTIYSAGIINFIGLDNLISIGGSLQIGRFDFMGEVQGNWALKSLHGLESLTSIGGDLYIINNHSLTTLGGLENLDKSTVNKLTIIENRSLSMCDLENICDYLSNPRGIVTIYNNAPGCNNPPEIAENCGFIMSCLPFGDYFFFHQHEIDNFPNSYPACTNLKGNVKISGDSIFNLSGLSTITSIDKNLRFSNNYSLTNLTGLNNLQTIGGDLLFSDNDSLTNLAQLSNLSSLEGSLMISYNKMLTNLIGLEGINMLNQTLYVYGNESLINMNGLNNITQVAGDVVVNQNHSMTDLSGLEKVASIGGYLRIYCHLRLSDISALGELNSIGGDLILYDNYLLSNLNGFKKLLSIGGDFYLSNNDKLTDIHGLTGLSSIGGFLNIKENDSLTSITGLTNLSSIWGGLWIEGNKKLSSLSGLDNIEASSIHGLSIINNHFLSNCEVKSVCEYLAKPTGEITIYGNNTGCISQIQIQEACKASSMTEVEFSENLHLFPNPFTTSTTITYELQQPSTVQITIYNHVDKQLKVIQQNQSAGKQQVVWNAEGLPGGVYFCVLNTESGMETMKMIKLK